VLDLLIGCGAWSLPLLSLTFFFQRQNAATVTFAFYVLALVCNNPHYMATIYRAYGTPTDFNRFRFFTIYVTALVALTIVLFHFVPTLFPWVVTLYLTWSPWHYTGQNFGIAQMFIRRTGAAPDATARQLLYGSYAASFAVWVLALHSIRDTDSNFISLQIPESVAAPLQIFFALIFVGCAVATFIRLGKQIAARNLVAPVLLTSTQLLWFVGPSLLTRFGLLELPAGYFSAGALAFMIMPTRAHAQVNLSRMFVGKPDDFADLFGTFNQNDYLWPELKFSIEKFSLFFKFNGVRTDRTIGENLWTRSACSL